MPAPPDLAAFGPYVAVEQHPADARREPPWRRLSELVGSPQALAERAEVVAAHLETAKARVAVSIAHLGYVARLLSPALATDLLGGGISLDPTTTWWQPVAGGPLPLSVATGAFATPLGALLAGPVADLSGHARALGCPSAVVTGNVASALQGAAVVVTSARPDLVAAARDRLTGLFAGGALAGTATGMPLARDFRRTSCCLIWQVSGATAGTVCADCVLG